MSLSGKRVLVTRPEHQSVDLARRLESEGASVTILPLIRIVEPDSWEAFDRAFSSGQAYDWVIFASVNAVEQTMNRLALLGLSGELARSRLACIGSSTAASLAGFGHKVDFVPQAFVAESMAQGFPGYPHLAGVRILWPRTDVGRSYLKDALGAAGARLDEVTCYRTVGPENPELASRSLRQLISSGQLDIITLTSSQTVASLHRLLADREGETAAELQRISLAVIGPETARQVERLFGVTPVQAREFTIAGLVEALVQAFAGR